MAKQVYGIIGHPVKHSLSPAMQNAAFKAFGIDAEYSLYDVEPARLADFLKEASKANIAGLNVTIPHKIKASEYLERHGKLDENARRLGAVNTIKLTNEGLCGYNTDGPGFYRSLVEDLGFEPEGKTIFVLGAGGAARAIAMYLGNGPKRIFIKDIDEATAEDLRSRYARYYDGARLVIVKDGNFNKALEESQLIVNATPVGMKETDGLPIEASLLRAGMYIYDLVYNRPQTELVKAANSRKLHAVTGLGMLLYQGAIAFEIWTGRTAPVDIMRRALKEALRNEK